MARKQEVIQGVSIYSHSLDKIFRQGDLLSLLSEYFEKCASSGEMPTIVKSFNEFNSNNLEELIAFLHKTKTATHFGLDRTLGG